MENQTGSQHLGCQFNGYPFDPIKILAQVKDKPSSTMPIRWRIRASDRTIGLVTFAGAIRAGRGGAGPWR